LHNKLTCSLKTMQKDKGVFITEGNGITFVTVLVSLAILAAGIVTLLKVFPVITSLSERAESNVSVSMIADNLFTSVEKIYGSKSGPEVPPSIQGECAEFPAYKYRISFDEKKKDLYDVQADVFWKREGKYEHKNFYTRFRRK
jgi:hypothetical protein